MGERLFRTAALAALVVASGSACAMSSPSPNTGKCVVEGAAKLPAAAGDSDAICTVIESSMAEKAPGIGYRVAVEVRTSSMLAATVTLESGKVLPEQKFAVMDHVLTLSMVRDFADSLAEQVRKAATV